MAKQANKHRRDQSYSVGDLVWLKASNLQLPSTLTRKLSARWVGPFPILHVISPTSYHLQLPASWTIHPVFHVSLLKPHYGPPVQPEAPVHLTAEGDEEFEVE